MLAALLRGLLPRRIASNAAVSGKALLSRARTLYAAHDWAAAEHEARACVDVSRRDPAIHAAAHVLLAECLIQQGRSDEARAVMGHVSVTIPAERLSFGELHSLGRVCYFLGEFRLAERHFELCLQREPGSAAALFGLAATLHRLGRRRGAVESALRALAADASLPGLWDAMGVMFDELCAADSPASDGDFLAAFGAGNDALRRGDWDEAERWFLVSDSLNPGWPFTSQRLGCICAIQNRQEEADAFFLKSAATGLKPDVNIRLGSGFLASLKAEPEGGLGPVRLASGPGREDDCRAVVFVSGDPGYMRRFVAPLLRSALENGTRGLLWHFHVVGADAWTEEELADVASGCPDVPVRLTVEAADFASGDQAKTYYACCRFVRLPELLERYRKPVLVLDFDLLVLGPLQELIDEQVAQRADVALVRWSASDWRIWDQFWASAVLVNCTEPGLRFATTVGRYVAHFLKEGGAWYLDQIALFAAFVANDPANGGATVGMIPPARCAVRHVAGDQPPRETLLWSVSFNITSNAAGLESDLFRQYLPRTRRLFGWQLPGNDMVFQEYLARCPEYRGRRLWDHEEMQYCLGRVRSRRRAIDIGAHVGFWSFWLADHFETVDAFEPHPLLQECFVANVRQENVRLHRCALGSAEGTADMALDGPNSGMAYVTRVGDGPIRMRTLDAEGFGDVDFVKIDAEGYERAILEGAEETLLRCRPLILIEQDERWSARYGDPPGAALQWLQSRGARVIGRFRDRNFLVAWDAPAPDPVLANPAR